MEFIWHILLTVCLGQECRTQDIQWFINERECRVTLALYEEIPPDGDWDTVIYECKPINSTAT